MKNIPTEMTPEQCVAHSSFLSELFILDDGRVNIPYFEIDVVLGCNLRCYYCTHLSPYRKGFVPTEKILHWFETWNKKIRPNKMQLLGGEPLLHPDLATVVLESRKIWNDSTLGLVTNGLLIHQAPQNILDALREAKFYVGISDHSGADLPRDKVISGVARLKENGVPYQLWPSNDSWYVQHRWNENNVPIPYQSPVCDAWSICLSKHHPSLANNQLYKCAILASMIEGVKEGSLSPLLWKDAVTYRPLSPDVDANTILEHFRTNEIRECSICPDRVYITEMKQMHSCRNTSLKLDMTTA